MESPPSVGSPLKIKYGDEVKELAFACYVQADRNISRARRMLAEALEGAPCPDRSVLSRWAKDDGWDLKATEAIGERFPYLNVEHAARFVALTPDAIDTYKAVLAGELDHLPAGTIRARIEVAKHVIDSRGFGIAGSRYGTGELPAMPATVNHDDAALSPQERQRRRLEGEREP